MKVLDPSRKFQRDYKRCVSRGLDLSKLEQVIDLLADDKELPARCRPHRLSGNWSGYWECHIAPDWLLIYDFDDEFLFLERTGTHADLF